MKKALNVGGNSREIPLPPQYGAYQQILLDIDPRGNPDIVCDARLLNTLPEASYDAVYCSHNLEHYYRHDVYKVLRGFHHVLSEGGFLDIRVPDMAALMQHVVANQMDIDDVLYAGPMGPITVRDVVYGHAGEIESSGNDFFAHKTGFMPKSLQRVLHECGFPWVFLAPGKLEIIAIAFKAKPCPEVARLWELPSVE